MKPFTQLTRERALKSIYALLLTLEIGRGIAFAVEFEPLGQAVATSLGTKKAFKKSFAFEGKPDGLAVPPGSRDGSPARLRRLVSPAGGERPKAPELAPCRKPQDRRSRGRTALPTYQNSRFFGFSADPLLKTKGFLAI